MICLNATEDLDVCITINAKVIFKTKASGKLEEEVFRKDCQLRGEYIARQFEQEVAEKVREKLAEELK
jgi:hypothetical protein